MKIETHQPDLCSRVEYDWSIVSSLAPEGRMHISEVILVSAILVALGVMFPYVITAIFESAVSAWAEFKSTCAEIKSIWMH